MPYVVTTKRLGTDPTRKYGGTPSVSRRAVATLGEARLVVLQQIGGGSALPNPTAPIDVPRSVARREAARLSELGGTVALPNGTRIEVERVSWTRLARDFAVPRGRSDADHAAIIAAFNATQAVEA